MQKNQIKTEISIFVRFYILININILLIVFSQLT